MSFPRESLQNLWYQALEEEIGVAIQVDDKPRLLNELYDVRKALGDPELEKIILCNPKGDEIFMVKKAVEL